MVVVRPTAAQLKQETKRSSPLLRNLGKFRDMMRNSGLKAKTAVQNDDRQLKVSKLLAMI